MTRTEYKNMWDRWQRRREAKHARLIKAVLRGQLEEYMQRGDISTKPMQDALTALYYDCGPSWAAKTGIARKTPVSIKARMPMGFSERIVQLMREYYGDALFLNLAEEITDTSRERIIEILNDAAITGIGIDDIVRQFPSDFGLKRARLISRTETVASANQAALLNAQDTGIPMQKIWMAITDRRTRHTHLIADNQTQPLDGFFNIGTVEISAPGAKKTKEGLNTPGRETIQCRCTQGFRIIK